MQKDTRYNLKVSDKADRIFRKISKKDPNQFNAIKKKIGEILINPEHFKPLRGDLHGSRRTHIDKSFVLIYEIKGNIVRILDYDHHDKIYG